LYKIQELRHRIDFQSLQKTADGQGGFTSAWVTYQSCWAKIKNASAVERVYGQKLEDNYTHEIIIRNTLDHAIQKASDRILFGTRIFQIDTIQFIDERKWWIKITAMEGVAS